MGAKRRHTPSLIADWRRWSSAALIRGGLRHHGFTLVSSLGRMRMRPINSLLTIGVIAIALALPAGLYATIKNLGEISQGWEALGDVALYLADGTTSEEAESLRTTLAGRDDILQTALISPQQAAEDMQVIAGFGDALAALPGNPLPWVLVLSPRDRDPARLASLAGELKALAAVDSAQFDLEWLERFRHLLALGQRAVSVIATLLGVAVILIVGNTIRLDIENRRREIEVTRLLGATDGFIRRPFLYGGFWFGVLGGLLAAFVVALATWILGQPIAELARAYHSEFKLHALNARESVQLVLLGAVIGWVGSWLAVSRQLARIRPD